MNLDEILTLAEKADETAMQCLQCAGDYHSVRDEHFYHAAIQHYKDSVLKEVGEPIAWTNKVELDYSEYERPNGEPTEGAFWSSYSEDDGIALYTADQLIAARKPLEEEIERLKDEQFKRLEREAEKRMKLREQLATAEQRVAEACYRALDEAYGNEYQLKAIGEYRKYMKGE